MLKRRGNRGVVLIMVLATILITSILANVVLTIVESHYELTAHQTSRIRAYYAAMAAMNLAVDKLRRSEWDTGTYGLCTSGCTGANYVNDSDIPYRVDITISAEGADRPGVRTVTLNVSSY